MELFNKLMKLDAFTRKQIINEFPNVLYVKYPLDTSSTEYFPLRKFRMNEFYGGFLLVLGIITLISYIFG